MNKTGNFFGNIILILSIRTNNYKITIAVDWLGWVQITCSKTENGELIRDRRSFRRKSVGLLWRRRNESCEKRLSGLYRLPDFMCNLNPRSVAFRRTRHTWKDVSYYYFLFRFPEINGFATEPPSLPSSPPRGLIFSTRTRTATYANASRIHDCGISHRRPSKTLFRKRNIGILHVTTVRYFTGTLVFVRCLFRHAFLQMRMRLNRVVD